MGHFWLHYKACTLGLNQDERDLVMVEGLLGVDLMTAATCRGTWVSRSSVSHKGDALEFARG
jgi:hypothetical protein